MHDLSVPNPDINPFDELRRVGDDGTEHWSARDLMPHLGYVEWRNFESAIERAKLAAVNSGAGQNHFVDANKVKNGGRWGQSRAADYQMTRYGAYLVAINGDPRKTEIAAAQTYFAVKTREAETAPTPQGPELLALAVIEAQKMLDVKDARIAELEPHAAAWAELADAEGDHSVAEAAKVLSRSPGVEIGQRRLFQLMADLGWIFRKNNHWTAYQRQVDNGRLVEMVGAQYFSQYHGKWMLGDPTIRVKLKGLAALLKEMSPGSELVLETPLR